MCGRGGEGMGGETLALWYVTPMSYSKARSSQITPVFQALVPSVHMYF